MRKIIILLLIVTSANAQSIPFDKQLHFGAGFGTSMFIGATTQNFKQNPKKAFWYGLASSVAIGVAKELKDEVSYGGFSNSDLKATVAGGIVGSFTTYILIDKKRFKGQKEKLLF